MQLLIGVLGVFTVFSMYVFMRVSFAQSEPYMDEIFHIPQARQYCAGNFSKVSMKHGLRTVRGNTPNHPKTPQTTPNHLQTTPNHL